MSNMKYEANWSHSLQQEKCSWWDVVTLKSLGAKQQFVKSHQLPLVGEHRVSPKQRVLGAGYPPAAQDATARPLGPIWGCKCGLNMQLYLKPLWAIMYDTSVSVCGRLQIPQCKSMGMTCGCVGVGLTFFLECGPGKWINNADSRCNLFNVELQNYTPWSSHLFYYFCIRHMGVSEYDLNTWETSL